MSKGTYFFDYGNSFLKAVYDRRQEICRNGENDLDGFTFPSYVEDILGPCLFDYGYGPFRWCCLSRNPEDLDKTDAAAAEYILAHNRAIRTTTTMSGSGTPRRTSWWWAPSAASCIRTRWAA
jgi:urocanate hydratase